MPDRPDIPEEAVELAAEALWNEREYRDPTGEAPDDWYPPGDNPDQQPPREPFLWERMVAEGKFEGDQEEYRTDALAVLQAATPARPLNPRLEAELVEAKLQDEQARAAYIERRTKELFGQGKTTRRAEYEAAEEWERRGL